MIPFLIKLIFTITLRNDDVQEFDTRWDEILLAIKKIRRMMFWKACTNYERI